MTMMFYNKLEENSQLQRKLEQIQLQQSMFLGNLMNQQISNNQNNPQNSSNAASNNTSNPFSQNPLMSLPGFGNNLNLSALMQ